MQTLSERIADYLETGEYEKRLSPDTIKAYCIDLRQFLTFTEGKWADKDMLNQHIKYLNLVQALLQNAYTPGCREVLRDIVVLKLLFSTGLRVSEQWIYDTSNLYWATVPSLLHKSTPTYLPSNKLCCWLKNTQRVR